ncbi:MAG: protein serine/threonine phosphatase [Chlorobi bacterium]|nr:protein serine/threonine phosphatase [Chlorobiota bacterium]
MSTPRENEESKGAGFQVGTRTDIGLHRKRNEDFLDVRSVPQGMLMVVCDGMGGPGNGDRASRLAVEAFMEGLSGEDTPEALLRNGAMRAGRAIIREIGLHPELAGMGTTMVAAVVRNDGATVANIGDSRAYLMHDGVLSRVSRDHSLVGEMVERGEITEGEAAQHPRRNIITRALGDHQVIPDIFEIGFGGDDMLLLATDGLHGMIGDAQIADALAGGDDMSRICDLLVQRALDAGGDDNVTVALIAPGAGRIRTEVPTDPGAHAVKKKGTTIGKIIAALLIASVIVVVVMSILKRPLFFNGADHQGPDDTVAAPATSDSSGWLDTSSYAPARADSLHPGDTLPR